jgi:hypothetical protein
MAFDVRDAADAPVPVAGTMGLGVVDGQLTD